MLAFALVGYVQVTAIDPLALLLVAACVLLVERPGALAAVLAVSVPVNEKVARVGRARQPFSRLNVLLVPALAAVALVLTQFFQAGRIAMHAAPILVVPAAAGIMGWLGAGRSGPDRGPAG